MPKKGACLEMGAGGGFLTSIFVMGVSLWPQYACANVHTHTQVCTHTLWHAHTYVNTYAHEQTPYTYRIKEHVGGGAFLHPVLQTGLSQQA